ncbi:putative reverse transcriptase domain-containing protein [Tanacetum coccineum]
MEDEFYPSDCDVKGNDHKDICEKFPENLATLKIKIKRGNQAGNDRAPAKVYAVGNAGANPDNVVAGTFLLNNRYAYILFDTGADRSFVSTAFSTLLDIVPNTLDHGYNVELADGRIIGVNTILMGCTLNLRNHPFNINLMPVEMGSFDVIIGMDWLSKYSAVIDCAKKIVRIPWRNKTLIIHGDGSTQGNVTRLNIISCTKTQKYMEKGFPIFLAHVTTKEVKGKSEMKRLEDVSIVKDFPKVFPEDLPGLPPTQQVEFQIDLVYLVCAVHGHLIDYRLPQIKSYLSNEEQSDKGFNKTQFLTWGAPVLSCQEIKTDHSMWSSVYSKIDPKFRLSQIKVFREEDIPEDCLQNSLGHYDFQVAKYYVAISVYHPGKANVVADALSRKEREPPLRVRALVMTISLDLPKQILNAQTEARKPENK